MPTRVQRSRRKGWRMPTGSVYVGRPTKWGNPFVAGRDGDRARCVELFQAWLRSQSGLMEGVRELRGRDLVCWCPLDEACHAQVLLDVANR